MQLSNYNDRLREVTHASDESALWNLTELCVYDWSVLMAELNHLYGSWCAAFVCVLASSCLPWVYSPSQPLGVSTHAPRLTAAPCSATRRESTRLGGKNHVPNRCDVTPVNIHFFLVRQREWNSYFPFFFFFFTHIKAHSAVFYFSCTTPNCQH